MEADVDAEARAVDSDVVMVVDVAGGVAEPAAADILMEVVRPRTQRSLPPPPSDRAALEWSITMQKHAGKHATCRACCTEFESSEYRFTRSSDSRAGTSRYLHATCVPG